MRITAVDNRVFPDRTCYVYTFLSLVAFRLAVELALILVIARSRVSCIVRKEKERGRKAER